MSHGLAQFLRIADDVRPTRASKVAGWDGATEPKQRAVAPHAMHSPVPGDGRSRAALMVTRVTQEAATLGLAALLTIGILGGIDLLAILPGSQGLVGAESAATMTEQAVPHGSVSKAAGG